MGFRLAGRRFRFVPSSHVTFQRSPAGDGKQLTKTPSIPLYCAADAKPEMRTRIPQLSFAAPPAGGSCFLGLDAALVAGGGAARVDGDTSTFATAAAFVGASSNPVLPLTEGSMASCARLSAPSSRIVSSSASVGTVWQRGGNRRDGAGKQMLRA